MHQDQHAGWLHSQVLTSAGATVMQLRRRPEAQPCGGRPSIDPLDVLRDWDEPLGVMPARPVASTATDQRTQTDRVSAVRQYMETLNQGSTSGAEHSRKFNLRSSCGASVGDHTLVTTSEHTNPQTLRFAAQFTSGIPTHLYRTHSW